MVDQQIPDGATFASHGPFSSNSPIFGNSRSNTPRPSIAGLETTQKDQYYNGADGEQQPQPMKPHTNGTRGPIGEDLIFQKTASWSHKKEQILMGPYDYMINHRGKNIRSQLIAAFNAWLKVPPESLEIITKVVGMLHTASLLVDDVEDSSILRRGVPVAHNIFGTAQTINSANYVYFIALQHLSSLNSTTAIQIYTTELLNLHRGQGMDLFWRETLTCPTENDYLEMVSNKTGGLFRLAIKLMQAESTRDASFPDCVPLVNTIGLLFQILDDYANLSSATYTAHKGLAEDLTEGKFSFPVIHAIRSDPSNLILLNILRQKTTDEEVKKYAIKYMDEKTGSFAYTRKVLSELTERALGLVEEMEKSDNEDDGIAGKAIRDFLEKMRVEEPKGRSEENGVPVSTGPKISEMSVARNTAG